MLTYFFRDILLTVWSSLPIGILFVMALWLIAPIIREKGVKTVIGEFIQRLREGEFRHKAYFWLYFYMLLNRTVLERSSLFKPFSDVLGGWKIYVRGYTGLDSQVIGNIIMFIPFAFLMLWAYERLSKSVLAALKNAACLSLLLSVSVEICQIIYLKGTFQISDMVLNLSGGIIGGLCFLLLRPILNKLNNDIKK